MPSNLKALFASSSVRNSKIAWFESGLIQALTIGLPDLVLAFIAIIAVFISSISWEGIRPSGNWVMYNSLLILAGSLFEIGISGFLLAILEFLSSSRSWKLLLLFVSFVHSSYS